MKKLIAMLCVFCMVGLATTDVMGQNPAARQTTSSSSRTQTTSSASSQAARQVKKGDVQLNKANSSYQRAQTISSTPNTRPATVPANNSSRTSTSTARPATSSTTARPASSSTTTRPVTTKPATSSTTTRPATSATTKPATSSSAATNRTTTGTPAATSTSARESNSTAHTSNQRGGSSAANNPAPQRGYNDQGQPKPQPAPVHNNNSNAPKCHPYMHPNYHNFGYYMNIPPRIRPVYYHGVPYYFYNSIFCRYINGRYIICRPPIGAVIAYSIFNTWRPIIVVYKNVSYYYDDGTFYRRHSNKIDYEVVAPPIGARVAELPSTYEEIVLDGNLYFKVDNVYYKEVIVSGYLWYEVVFVA
ncbi:MAG: hypothetical protein J6T86_03990 [Bacteroidales bacterium]|nr:hypothetical protein [Bacteroidales bacterium]